MAKGFFCQYGFMGFIHNRYMLFACDSDYYDALNDESLCQMQ